MTTTKCRPGWLSIAFIGIVLFQTGVSPAAGSPVTGTITQYGSSTPAMTFSTQELIDIQMLVEPAAEDIGKTLPVYVVAYLDTAWYMRDAQSRWIPWNRKLEDLVATDTRALSSEETLSVLNGTSLGAGEYGVYAGYRSGMGKLIYNPVPLSFLVFDQAQPRLTPLLYSQTMESYLKLALQQGVNSSGGAAPGTDFTLAPSTPAVSDTNVQESGVDEADLMETQGDRLYWLDSCDSAKCLRIFKITEEPAGSLELGRVALDTGTRADGLYLLAAKSADESDLAAIVGGGSEHWPGPVPMLVWDAPWQWRQASTDLTLLDVTSPASIEPLTSIRIDGALVSSRRIADRLYLLTRFTPYIQDYQPWPEDQQQIAENQALLDKQGLGDLVPEIRIDGVSTRVLADPRRCHLPAAGADIAPDPSIISITVVPLRQPDAWTSSCFLGPSETLYMSTEALYLASSKYKYQATGGPEFAPQIYPPEQSTDIHKFKLDGTAITYRGSGNVTGHLGWEQDKKPFRMGEHEGVLRIATSHGETWNNNSTTSTALLRESAQTGSLNEISRIDDIGKPGERLYAARFIGERGYLVTFRMTDPLYVLDLSDPDAPSIAGELEIDGYSDYLHPIGERLLLGIGKDAVPDEAAPDLGFRGAWYQGLKISLFDVSDATSPTEVDHLVIGKRGTSSAALYDHHALSYLQAYDGSSDRVALPVELHDTRPAHQGFDPGEPSSFYDWTHTGLYVFDIDVGSSPRLRQAGSIIVEEGIQLRQSDSAADRSVLQGRAVHYLHKAIVYSEGL